MPKPWTTKDQLTWLNARKNDFLEAQKQDITTDWLNEVNEMWFLEFPELKACFPNKDAAETLTPKEEEDLQVALKKWKGVSYQI